MPNIGQLLKDEIRRIARREIRAGSEPMRKQIRALRETVRAQQKTIARLEEAATSPSAPAAAVEAPTEETPVRRRWTPASIKRQRSRLRLSQRELSQILGVSANTVARWETGTSHPRPAHRVSLEKLRGLGVRAARRMLNAED